MNLISSSNQYRIQTNCINIADKRRERERSMMESEGNTIDSNTTMPHHNIANVTIVSHRNGEPRTHNPKPTTQYPKHDIHNGIDTTNATNTTILIGRL